MEYTLSHFMGYRYGLFSFGTKTTSGYADFDFFRIGNTVENPIYINTEGADIVVAKSADVKFVKDLAVAEVAVANGISVSPNPASEYVTVSGIKDLVRLELYTTAGEKVRSSKSSQLPVTGLSSGTYLLRITDKASCTVQKLIVR